VGRTSSDQLVLRRTRTAPIYPDLLGLILGHPAGVADQVSLAWLATSIPTLGGALGAALRPRRVAREDTNTRYLFSASPPGLRPGGAGHITQPGSARDWKQLRAAMFFQGQTA
jgi:hypothetical protein